MNSDQIKEHTQKIADVIFYPIESRTWLRLQIGWLSGLFLLGVYFWGQFLSWNTLNLNFSDWAEITVPRLEFLQNALRSGLLPLHMASSASLHNITDRFFCLPDIITTPQTLLLLVVNIPTFILLDILIYYLIGFCGLLWLRSKFKLSLFAFSVLFFLFNFNGYILSHYAVGHFSWSAYFLFPLVFMFIFRFLDGEQNWKWLAGFAFTLFYMILAGGQHFFSWILIFMGVLCIFCWRRSLWLIGVGFFSGLLSAIRLLPPVIVLTSFYDSKLMRMYSGYASLTEIFDSMLFLRRNSTVKDLTYYNLKFYGTNQWEFYFFVGMIGVAFLLVFGFYYWLRKGRPIYWELFFPILFMVALTIGNTFGIIRFTGLPIFASERVPSRIISLPVVLLMILAVINFQTWLNQKRPGLWQLFIFASVLGLFINDLYNNLLTWQLSVSAILYVPKPMDPLGSLVNNHSDPAYKTVLIIGFMLTSLMALFLVFMALREKKREKI